MKIWQSLVLVVIFLLSTISINSAQSNVLVRWQCETDEPIQACKDRGSIEYLMIYGSIDDDTALAVARIDGLLPPGKTFPPVLINSPGGDARAGMWIGRILRRRNASIEGKDMLFTENDAICLSACVIVAAGAVSRQFQEIGLHQGAIRKVNPEGGFTYDPVSADFEKLLNEYWDEMGISKEIQHYISNTNHVDMTYLTFDPMQPREVQPIVQLGFRMKKDILDLALPSPKPFPISPRRSLEVDLLEAGTEAGDFTAAKSLAMQLLQGDEQLPKDAVRAVHFLKRASDLGDVESTYMLGYIYEKGARGVPADLELSFAQYTAAAFANHATARVALARLYLSGKGTQQSHAHALYWATLAAEQGEPYGYAMLGELMSNYPNEQSDDVQAHKWLMLAFERLPDGKTKQRVKDILYDVGIRMSIEKRSQANRLARQWRPMKPATPRQRGLLADD